MRLFSEVKESAPDDSYFKVFNFTEESKQWVLEMNAKAYKIYQDVKDMNPFPEVNCELRKEYVCA